VGGDLDVRRLAAVLLALAAACGGDGGDGEVATLQVSSPAFEEGDTVPEEFTCLGADTSPPLEWSGVPEAAAELRLTVTDPDAPGEDFTHWQVSGIDPSATGVGPGEVPKGGTEEENSFGETGYGGPCVPPEQTHRYVWTVEAMSEDGEVVAMGTLTARFGA
jgi:Raf kinase inhibitor-like YbhB/YbcL family protein